MWDKGTNLHHALLLANRHFRKHPNAQPVLLIVTDGEPTSHLESGGEVRFAYPPRAADHRGDRARAGRLACAWGRRPRSSGWATTRAWPGSSTRWRSGSKAASWPPRPTTWARPSSGSYLGSRSASGGGETYRDLFFGERGFWA